MRPEVLSFITTFSIKNPAFLTESNGQYFATSFSVFGKNDAVHYLSFKGKELVDAMILGTSPIRWPNDAVYIRNELVAACII